MESALRVQQLAQQAVELAAAGRTAKIPKAPHLPRCWNSPANLTLLTVAAGLPDNYKSCLRHNRMAYAEQHRLEYCEYDDAPIQLRVNFCWQKLVAVQTLLRDARPRRMAVFWLDADALVMDVHISAFDILHKYAKDFIFASDYNSCDRDSPAPTSRETGPAVSGRCDEGSARRISGGVFMVRNSQAARARLDYIWTQGAKASKHWGDGGSADNVEFDRWRAQQAADFDREAVSIDQTIMNSMRKTYLAGDFIFHHAGGGYEVAAYEANNRTNGNPAKYAKVAHICETHTHTRSRSEQQRRDVEEALQRQTIENRKKIHWPALAVRQDRDDLAAVLRGRDDRAAASRHVYLLARLAALSLLVLVAAACLFRSRCSNAATGAPCRKRWHLW